MEQEWRTMAGGEASPQAWEAFNQLWQAYLQVEPQTAYENAWFTESLSRLNELASL